jgi:3',5'-cyclic AMP phosphodiesterase CpdA
MLTLAHLSDVHLAPLPRPRFHHLMSKRFLGYMNWQRRKGHHKRDVLDAIVGDMLAREPGHVAVTGDLVNLALPEEFAAARLWLDELGTPETVTVVPGNHDAYSPFLRDPRLRHWRPYMMSNEAGAEWFGAHGIHFPFVRLIGRVALIGLSSARATLPLMASGWLGRRQMREAANILSRLGKEGYCRIVLIHHPPLPGMTSHVRALHDARRFKAVLKEHGAELVLHGHNHRTMQEWLPTSGKPIPIIGVSSASLLRDMPEKCASYNLFTIEENGAGWAIEMLTRRLDLQGQFSETNQSLIAKC